MLRNYAKKRKTLSLIFAFAFIGLVISIAGLLLSQKLAQKPIQAANTNEALDLQLSWREKRPLSALVSFSQNYLPKSSKRLSLELGVKREGYLQQTIGEYASASQLQRQALWLMVQPRDSDDIQSAIAYLELALQKKPKDANLALDLASAYSHLAERTGAVRSLPLAYDAVLQSLTWDQKRFHSHYNLALILESLFLNRQARDAWEVCLGLTQDPLWQKEITGHLQRLHQPSHRQRWAERLPQVKQHFAAGMPIDELIEGFWPDVSHYLEWELLPSLHCHQEPDLLAIALAEAMAGTDAFWSDVLSVLPAPGTKAFERQAKGFAVAKEVLEKMKENDDAAVQELLAEAEILLADSPYFWRLRYQAADLASSQENKLASQKIATSVARVAQQKGYLNLEGQARWLVYLVEFQTRTKKQRLQDLDQIEMLFAAANTKDDLAGIANMRAELFLKYGDFTAALEVLCQGLELLPQVSKPKRHAQIYSLASHYFQQAGHLDLSLRYAKENLISAERYGEKWMIVAAHQDLQPLLWELGQRNQAMVHARKAEAYQYSIKDESVVALLEANQEYSQALQMPASPARLTRLECARMMMRSLSDFSKEPQMLEIVAETHAELGDLEQAINYYRKAVGIYEKDLVEATTKNRRSLLRHIGKLYRALAELTLGLGRDHQAFFFSEANRTKFLQEPEGREEESSQRWQPLELKQIQAALNQETTLLIYQQDSLELYVWIVQHDDFLRVHLTSDVETLATLAKRFVGGLKRGMSDLYLSQDSKTLYSLLIEPIKAKLGQDVIGFVLDRPLYGLPLAALMDGEGRFLTETRVLAEAPSGTAFVNAQEQGGHRFDPVQNSVSLIGANRFDVFEHPGLNPLEGAREEVESLASLWEESCVFGSDATKTAVLQAMDKGGLVHLASHALTDWDGTRNSRFILAPDKKNNDLGILRLSELENSRVSKVWLLILSACSTAKETFEDDKSVVNFTQALIAKGIPSIIASYWDVDDAETRKLMLAFHSELRLCYAPAHAYSRAQRNLIAQGLQASVWASFGVFGHASKSL